MKRLLSLILLALTCFALYANDTDPINLVFIGNSITYGANLSDPATQAPPVKVAANVRKETGRDVYYRNCGLSGSATPNWMPGQQLFTNADKAATELQKAHPGVLFFSMMLGTNDTHQGYKTSPETYYQNMKTIVEELLTRHPEAHIIVNYPTWYSPNTHNGAVYLEAGLERLKTYIPMITRLCDLFQKSERPQVWPGDPTVFSFFENQTQYFVAENGNSGVFYLHPNLTGGTKLAEFWTKSIVEHLADLQPVHSDDELLLDKARATEASCMQVDKSKLTGDSRIIGNGQLTTNGEQTESCKVGNLVDMNPATYYEVDEQSTALSKAPWLQVDLKGRTVEQMVMSMRKRSDSNVATRRDRTPSDITILGSPDGETWERITALHEIKTTNGYYVSPVVKVGGTYRFLRLCVNNTVSLSISEGGALTWSMSEMQLYSVDTDLASSPYATVEGLKDACDALNAAIGEFAKALADGTLSDGQRTALSEATARVEALYKPKDPGSDADPNIVYIDDLNSDDTYCYNKTKGLISLRINLKANSEEKNAGTYFGTGNLLSTSTDYNTIIWHTDWTTDPLPLGVDNYLQAKLKTKQSSICFSMIGSNWNSTYDTPDHMVILASNTPSDESSWVEVAELPDMIPEELHGVHPAFYNSPRIDLGGEYANIRFVIKETVNHRLNRNGNIYVSLARFQVYQPTLVEDNIKILESLVRQLSDKVSDFQAGTMPGYYPQDRVEAFRAALCRAILLVNMNPTQDEAGSMYTELSSAYKAVEESLIRLEEGYYWIQSGHKGFRDVQGEKKALVAEKGQDLQWTTYDAEDASQLFCLTSSGNGWKLQSVATGEYVGQADAKGKRIAMAEEGVALSITSGSEGTFVFKNGQGNPIAVETTRNDAMKQGFVAAYTPTPSDLSGFYLLPVPDAAKSQLDAQAHALQVLQTADDLYAEAMGCGSRELLTQASQLYANSEMSGFPVGNLLDKGTAYDKIIFHSIWGNGALPEGVNNYLQVNLLQPQRVVRFSMIGSSWSSTYDTPDEYVIMATDTPEDEGSWKEVAELHDMIPQALHATYPAFYNSPLIDLGKAYTHLRFVVISTVNNRSNGHGNIYFSLARFQVYGNEASPKYDTIEKLAAAVDDMVALRDEIRSIPQNAISPDQVSLLEEKEALVRNILDGKGDGIAPHVGADSGRAGGHVYSLEGRRLNTIPTNGVYIRDGQKYVGR